MIDSMMKIYENSGDNIIINLDVIKILGLDSAFILSELLHRAYQQDTKTIMCQTDYITQITSWTWNK